MCMWLDPTVGLQVVTMAGLFWSVCRCDGIINAEQRREGERIREQERKEKK